MPWRNYVAGLTDATLRTLSGRNVGNGGDETIDCQDGHGARLTALHDADSTVLRCQKKGWASEWSTFQAQARVGASKVQRYPPQLVR